MEPEDSLGQEMWAGSWLLGRERPRGLKGCCGYMMARSGSSPPPQAARGIRGCYQENWGSLFGILS